VGSEMCIRDRWKWSNDLTPCPLSLMRGDILKRYRFVFHGPDSYRGIF